MQDLRINEEVDMVRLNPKSLVKGKFIAALLCMLSIAGVAHGDESPGQGLKILEHTRVVPVIEQEKKGSEQGKTTPVKKVLVKKFKINGNTLLP
jgi:hypothetical protein